MGSPFGFCECGCGQKTTVAEKTDRTYGRVKGQPVRFVLGHATRAKPEDLTRQEDRGHDTPCWIFQRHIDMGGYGVLQRNGKKIKAHRYFYEQTHGPVPSGLTLDHLCAVPACVNPGHLEPVTMQENIKRRNERIGRHPVAKLWPWQVRAIRRAHEEADLTTVQLGRAFGVNASTITQLLRRETWKEV
jgi:hypothetical protein